MGKLGYVAPEQASLEKAWDHRVDIFASGIILYELLTKQKPFPKAIDVESLVQSRKARVLAPTAIDERLPREIDPIILRALAYDPEKRYPEARAFADALVDLLFPTPHSAIQDSLGKMMHQVYAERVARQRTARAHDALVMKVLQHSAQQQAHYEKFTDSREPVTTPAPFPRPDDFQLRAPGETRVRTRTVRVGVPAWRAVVTGLLLALLGAAGLYAGEVYLREGVLVVTSSPAGASIALDGRPASSVTPAVIEGVLMSRPHTVQLSFAQRKSVTLQVKPRIGALVGRVHGDLASAMGRLTVESEPPGAEVLLDDRPAGATPISLTVRVDERHRIDLTLPGYEIDQFVVLPEKDGGRFRRKLVPIGAKGPRKPLAGDQGG